MSFINAQARKNNIFPQRRLRACFALQKEAAAKDGRFISD
jgi:hypothetical protein